MERRESIPPSRWGWLALAACVVAAIAQVPIEFDHGEPATPPSVATPESTSTVAVPRQEPAQIGEDPAAAPTALAPAGRESSVDSVSGDALTRLVVGAPAPTAQRATP